MEPGVVPAAPHDATPEPFVPFRPGAAPGALWAFAAKTTPAEETSRQAPMVREATRCFISAPPFEDCVVRES